MVTNLFGILNASLEHSFLVGTWVLPQIGFICIDNIRGRDVGSCLLVVVEEVLHLCAAQRCPAPLDQVCLLHCQILVPLHEAEDKLVTREVVLESNSVPISYLLSTVPVPLNIKKIFC